MLTYNAFIYACRGKLPARANARVRPDNLSSLPFPRVAHYRSPHVKSRVPRGSPVPLVGTPKLRFGILNCYPYMPKRYFATFFSIFNICLFWQCFTELFPP